MPLLTDATAAVLRSDPVSALAAMFVIGRYHPELMLWAARAMGDAPADVEPRLRRRKANGAEGRLTRVRKTSNGHRKPRSDDPRLARRDEADEQLIEAMKANPGASIGDLAAAIGRSRSTAVATLARLRDAGLAESVDKVWRLVEEPAPREPPAKWVRPLTADREQRVHAHV
jgi:DNA-binding transcriptional ArsR family regulator